MDSSDSSIEPEQGFTDLQFIDLHPEPWPEDNRRIRVHVEVTPFEQRPDLDLAILDARGEEVATVTIVEMLDPKFVITMHLRGDQTSGAFTLRGRLHYSEQEPLAEASHPFELPDTPTNLS